MKKLLLFLIFTSSISFAETTTFKCEAKGISFMGHSSQEIEHERLIRLNTNDMTMKVDNDSTLLSCELSPNKEWYNCSKTNFVSEGEYSGKYYYFYQINRRDFSYKVFASITERINNQNNYTQQLEGNCKIAEDYKF